MNCRVKDIRSFYHVEPEGSLGSADNPLPRPLWAIIISTSLALIMTVSFSIAGLLAVIIGLAVGILGSMIGITKRMIQKAMPKDEIKRSSAWLTLHNRKEQVSRDWSLMEYETSQTSNNIGGPVDIR